MVVLREWLNRNKVIFLLIFISALAYLPHINQFGYYRDDWYLMYSANALGGDVFHQIYAIDRPIRAFVMSFAYSLFGLNPLYYNLSAYLFRLLGAFAFFSTLQMVWHRQRNANLLASLLFLVFPGFLSTPNAIDYQAQQLSLFLALSSIALSVKTTQQISSTYKTLIWIAVAFMSFTYLGLVEYFLGLEALRLVIVFTISRSVNDSMNQQIRRTFINWFPSSIGVIAFLIWRFFIFDSERKATDLGAQIAGFIQSPLLVGIDWMRTLVKDIFEVTLLSWWTPLSDLWNISLRLREVFFVGMIALLVIALTIWALKNNQNENRPENSTAWTREAFWVGLVTIIAGFIPVILSNRDADFGGLSRYMLASSVGAVILVVAFMSQLNSQKVYIGTACVLILSSVLTHHFNGLVWARSSDAMQNFWWQVSWRIPQLQEKTTLVVNYSHTAIEEDYFIWGPANLIYYPQSTNPQRAEPAIWGLVLNRESTMSILNHAAPTFLSRRSIITYLGYDDILILTQPSLSSCVQVIDGNLSFVSAFEQYDIQTIAGESNQSNIVLDQNTPPPLEVVFGTEPEHDWCYYYQMASLAFQRGEYETVLDIKQKAKRLGYSAKDPVEWIPFLQAAILLENYDEASELAR
ncbi:MAG: hypothetical protein JNM46_06085, partial [Anaerolineales bacterium]|nr:hypothetical protein [Anaerolineales bacterium]